MHVDEGTDAPATGLAAPPATGALDRGQGDLNYGPSPYELEDLD